MTDRRFTLVGDGIENPYNAMTMQHAAMLFGGGCAFLDRKDLATTWPATFPDASPPQTITHQALGAAYSPIIACDNDEGACEIYGFRPNAGARPAVIVGNERLGLAYRTRRLARQAVYIPMAARGIDTLNVAAASAVALYYLTHGSGAQDRAPRRAYRYPAPPACRPLRLVARWHGRGGRRGCPMVRLACVLSDTCRQT